MPAPGPLDNPLKGWCTYIDAGVIHQPYSLVYQYVSWKELEPREGDYQISAWESRAWSRPLARGKHVVFRVYLDMPGKPSGVPDWLLAKGLKTRSYTDYGGGQSPDYDNPALVAGLERLIAALGRRYDRDPRVAFVALGMLGFWGEWHTYPHTDWFASEATQQRIVTAYHRAFPDKILMGRYPFGVLGQQAWLGFHDDMFPPDTDGTEDWKFLPKMRRSGRTNNWKVAAVGGEMEPGAADRWLGTGYSTTVATLDAAHMTWIGPYSPALASDTSPQFLARSQALVRRMGYQFFLHDLHYSSGHVPGNENRLNITIHGENQGVAPFYYPWPVRLVLMSTDHRVMEVMPANVDIRSWLPGRFSFHTVLTTHVRPGRYLLALGVVDPLTGRPSLRFANNLPYIQGWTILTDIRVPHP